TRPGEGGIGDRSEPSRGGDAAGGPRSGARVAGRSTRGDPDKAEWWAGAGTDQARRRSRAGGGRDGAVSRREDLDRAANRAGVLLRLRVSRRNYRLRRRARDDRRSHARTRQGGGGV